MRDSRSYIASFAPPTSPSPSTSHPPAPAPEAAPNPLVGSLLNPIVRRPALVKIQGPFTDHQLQSVCRGIQYLQRMGLVSVVVIDRDDVPPSESDDADIAEAQRTLMLRDVERCVDMLTRARAPARPILSTVARMGADGGVFVEAEGLDHIRRTVEEGEIPVLMPVALDEGCRSRRINANRVLAALAQKMSEPAAGAPGGSAGPEGAGASEGGVAGGVVGEGAGEGGAGVRKGMDLTPVRLLVINREGGIPSYARSGLPHLSINLASELDFISSTWREEWRQSHPTALANLNLADECLAHMPRGASALIVSHRSPAALIANLITNKPAHSASLPHSLLEQSEGRITPDTPTLIRKGLPVEIVRDLAEIDRTRLTGLLERSFGRKLNQEKYFSRLEKDLDFIIVIGDYVAAAIVTKEGPGRDICYLDKFAVLPENQGDGTVDFLWVALRDETYGLGLLDAMNPSIGSLRGVGQGKDLVWRSRSNNPVNKWYFERSNGSLTCGERGEWKLFWCDAEQRVRDMAQENGSLMRVIEPNEKGRLERWAPAIMSIKSAWSD